MEEKEIIEYNDLSSDDTPNNVETQEISVADIQDDVEIQETLDVVEVTLVDGYDVGMQEAFPAYGDDDYYNHALLNNRELHDQHPITAITGLRKELDSIEALQTVYSNHMGVANYYKWHDAAYDVSGYFVSVVPNTDEIQICEGADIFGVIVDEAAFVGGQDGIILEDVDNPEVSHGAPRNNEYGLVVTSGLVDVHCELDVEVGDYVISDSRGYAKKAVSSSGYKVVAIEDKHGVKYAVIALGIQGDITDKLGVEVIKLDERMDAAESNIISAINTANQAYHKAEEIEASNQIMSDKVDGALSTLDKAYGDMTDANEYANQAARVSAQAKAIAEGAVAYASKWRQEALDAANQSLTEMSELRDELKKEAEEMSSDLQETVNNVEALKEDLKPLATWPSYIEILGWTNKESASEEAIYYDTTNELYWYYADEDWQSGADFPTAVADSKERYYVIDIQTYWYYRDEQWRATKNMEEAGITSYAGFVAKADKDSATLASIVEWKGTTGESMAAFMQEAKDDHAQVSAIARYKRTDTDTSATEGASGLIAQVNDTKASVQMLAEFDGGIAGLKAQVTKNASELSAITQHTYNDATGLAAIKEQVTEQETKITNITSWQSGTNTSLASIRQKADGNGAAIQLTASNLGMYTVGPQSQAYGFNREQAEKVLEPGMIYVPTENEMTETYAKSGDYPEYSRTFSKSYLYKWDKLENEHYGWVTVNQNHEANSNVGPSVYFTKTPPSSVGTGYGYWYTDGVPTDNSYNAYTLYKWQNYTTTNADGAQVTRPQWVAVATRAGNSQNRAMSQIRQTTNGIVAEVTDAYGAVAGFGAKLSKTEAKVNSIASWPGDNKDTHHMAIFEQKAGDDGNPYMVLATVRNVEQTDDNGEKYTVSELKELGGATIVLSGDAELGSYINLDADKINFDSKAFTVRDANNNVLLSAGNGQVGIVDFTVGKESEHRSYLYSNQSNYSGTQFDNREVWGEYGVYLGTDGIGLGGGDFYVTKQGYLLAQNGLIGGWNISKNLLYSGNVGLISSGTTDDSIRIYAGSATANKAPFKVTDGGYLYSTYGEIGGWSIGNNCLFRDNVSLYTGDMIKYTSLKDGTSSPLRIAVGAETHSVNVTVKITTELDGMIDGVQIYTLPDAAQLCGYRLISCDAPNIQDSELQLTQSQTKVDVYYPANSGLPNNKQLSFTFEIRYMVTPQNAPFKVLNDGSLYAANASIRGDVYATGGNIGGWALNENILTSGDYDTTVMIDANSSNGYAFSAGSEAASSAPFSVTKSGVLSAIGGSFLGNVVAGECKIGPIKFNTNSFNFSNITITLSNFTTTRAQLSISARDENRLSYRAGQMNYNVYKGGSWASSKISFNTAGSNVQLSTTNLSVSNATKVVYTQAHIAWTLAEVKTKGTNINTLVSSGNWESMSVTGSLTVNLHPGSAIAFADSSNNLIAMYHFPLMKDYYGDVTDNIITATNNTASITYGLSGFNQTTPGFYLGTDGFRINGGSNQYFYVNSSGEASCTSLWVKNPKTTTMIDVAQKLIELEDKIAAL